MSSEHELRRQADRPTQRAGDEPIVLPNLLGAWVMRQLQRASSLFDRLPIRWRLAAVSALLTFTILCAFALVVGSLTVHRIRANFNREVAVSGDNVAGLLQPEVTGSYIEGFKLKISNQGVLARIAESEDAIVRVMTVSGTLLASTARAPDLGLSSEVNRDGYRVHTRPVAVNGPIGGVIVQYGRRLSDLEATIARVELLLVLGVLAATMLALLAGIAIARRAMAPIAELTSTAEQIARTRDPSQKMPEPLADDEVAELARTLGGMLKELDAAHAETEQTLARQRQFVADASHELRTPLTSVLANLELLSERSEIGQLHGDEAEAVRSALRSSQRMRRLVADLLLLARSDVGRVVRREPCNLAQIAVEAAAELGPVSDTHEISIAAQPVVVQAARDELHRLALNLIENALRHTPPGTAIRVSTEASAPRQARLVVEDDGPGVPNELAASVFERFVRGAGDRGGSFGLGLAIVRAVSESHGGIVTLEQTHPGAERPGARFVVTLPAADASASDLDHDRQHHRAAA
jgi:signal transduction histidine kinase